METKFAASQAVLLRRRGIVYVHGDRGEPAPDNHLQAVEIEWAALGQVPSERLRAKLRRVRGADLAAISAGVIDAITRRLGADRTYEPLFRKFPDDVPE